MFSAYLTCLSEKQIPCRRHFRPHSIFCLRILFSSSTKFLSEVACPMSLFLFSFCWKVSTRRFFRDRSPFSDSSSDHQSSGRWGRRRVENNDFLITQQHGIKTWQGSICVQVQSRKRSRCRSLYLLGCDGLVIISFHQDDGVMQLCFASLGTTDPALGSCPLNPLLYCKCTHHFLRL